MVMHFTSKLKLLAILLARCSSTAVALCLCLLLCLLLLYLLLHMFMAFLIKSVNLFVNEQLDTELLVIFRNGVA